MGYIFPSLSDTRALFSVPQMRPHRIRFSDKWYKFKSLESRPCEIGRWPAGQGDGLREKFLLEQRSLTAPL